MVAVTAAAIPKMTPVDCISPRKCSVDSINRVELIDAAMVEADFIRARHDGVHVVQSLRCGLSLLRELARLGLWTRETEACFEQAMNRLRQIDRSVGAAVRREDHVWRSAYDRARALVHPKQSDPATVWRTACIELSVAKDSSSTRRISDGAAAF